MMKNYSVTGMTCSHCVQSVKEEVAAVPGVQGVDVTFEDGHMTVTGEDFSDTDIQAAVQEAGYDIA